MINGNKTQNLYVMMFTLQTLHNRGISIKETVYGSLENLLQWYNCSLDKKYLELAQMHMQAYVNMGFALDEKVPCIYQILFLSGKKASDFFPRDSLPSKRIRINKAQIRGMLGKWCPTKENPMTIHEVVDDILWKLKNQQEGHYIYQYQKKSTKEGIPEIYELVINREESYFFDVKNFRFYTFLQEEKHDKNSDSRR